MLNNGQVEQEEDTFAAIFNYKFSEVIQLLNRWERQSSRNYLIRNQTHAIKKVDQHYMAAEDTTKGLLEVILPSASAYLISNVLCCISIAAVSNPINLKRKDQKMILKTTPRSLTYMLTHLSSSHLVYSTAAFTNWYVSSKLFRPNLPRY